MKFSYKFSNLLGTVYRQGNLLFTPDGNSVISPVGNRISIHDLRSNKTSTLPVESKFNFTALDIHPNGCILVAANEQGDAFMISLVSQTVTHKYKFKRKVNAIKFSPDGKHFAVCKENNVFVFKSPGPFTGQYNGFVMERVFHNFYDETTCLDWSFDSKILAIGSKDMSIKLFSLEKWKNFKTYALGGHSDSIVACFFEEKTYDITTISKNGQTAIWECSIDPEELIPFENLVPPKRQRIGEELEEDVIDFSKAIEQNEEEISKHLEELKSKEKEENEKDKKKEKLYYKRLERHYLADEVRKENRDAVLTAAAYHRKTKILVIGFSTGAFFIYELPDVNLIHSLSVSEQIISSISLNCTGDWIALGCGGLGQLLVWEWQSETYVLKQQGHSNNISCVCYSPDGQFIATGGEDAKVKLWSVTSGFCFVTFNEHSGPVTSVCFSGNKKFVVSASLDGTARAYDIIRYRNFRTLTTPRPVQLSCVAVDSSGEFVASGGQDVFEIFLWSVKTGRLLEVLAGHEGPVWSVAFSPISTSTTLVSVSWDKTLRIWDAIEKGSEHETIQLPADGLCVCYKPDGQEVAVATLDGQITTFHVRTATQTGSIEGRNDLGSGRSDTDLITAKKTLESKAFTSVCYSADGEHLLAGGQSKNVCIYNVKEGLLVKKFEVTQNRSFDAVDDFINRRKLTEFGNLNLVEEREENEGGNVTIRLPGAKKGDMAARSFKPEVRIFSLQFSPTGQAWAAATTEGLLIYSLNLGLVFDPFDLEVAITPKAIREAIKNDQTNALVMAIKLNEASIIQEVIENIPVDNVELTLSNIGQKFAERLLIIIASALDSSRHLEFYLVWAQHLLTLHGNKIDSNRNMPGLLALQKSLTRKYENLSKLCDFNSYSMQVMTRANEKQKEVRKVKNENMEVENENSDEENIMLDSD